MLEAYRKHVEERAAEGIVPKPLDAEQVAALVELLKPHLKVKKNSFLIYLLTVYHPVLMKPLTLKPVF